MAGWITGTCKSNGIDIHYLRTGGNKPPVVLLYHTRSQTWDLDHVKAPGPKIPANGSHVHMDPLDGTRAAGAFTQLRADS
jgi:hypothetical protein